MTDRDDEDAAAVLAILLALRSPTTQATAPQPSRWGHPDDPARWTPGPDAWWASGLAG